MTTPNNNHPGKIPKFIPVVMVLGLCAVFLIKTLHVDPYYEKKREGAAQQADTVRTTESE